MKKILAMLLTVLMLSTMCTAFALDVILIAPNPNAAPKTVSLQVESVAGSIYAGEVVWSEGATALSVLESALTEAGVEYVIKDSQYGGKYISSIGADAEAQFGGYDGWMYFVDGQSPMFSIDACVLQGGEQVQVAYGDMNLMLPIVTATRDYKGLVSIGVQADVTYYDEFWNMSIVREPMAEVKLTVDGVEYVTDAQGKALLSAEDSAKETVSVQLEKLADTGAPLLVRLAPDYQLDLTAAEEVMPFSDLPKGEWFTEPVLKMLELGVVNGMPDGSFQPTGTVTRAQVANMLFKLAGQPAPQSDAVFADVKADSWYADAVRWAYEQGIVTGSEGKFRPDDAVTRQELAVMLVRYQEKVVKTALPEVAEAPAFADNDQIAAYASEAVYLLQKAGIVTGADGRFQPAATATRGQVCKMLAGLVG